MNTKVRLFSTKVRNLIFRTNFGQHCSIVLLLAGLMCFCGLQAMAQSVPPDEEITDAPLFIVDLVENTELTQEQVDEMRSGGAGWGNMD